MNFGALLTWRIAMLLRYPVDDQMDRAPVQFQNLVKNDEAGVAFDLTAAEDQWVRSGLESQEWPIV